MVTAAPKFRIDVAINDLLTNASQKPPAPAEARGLTLPVPVYPQHPERANYTLELIGEDEVRTHSCYVLHATPKRADKYLFEGKVWIDKQDFAVARIEGHPAANLSFWIKRADFVRDYEGVAGFWLPLKDETVVQVRMYGKKILTIDHADYAVRARPLEAESGR